MMHTIRNILSIFGMEHRTIHVRCFKCIEHLESVILSENIQNQTKKLIIQRKLLNIKIDLEPENQNAHFRNINGPNEDSMKTQIKIISFNDDVLMFQK